MTRSKRPPVDARPYLRFLAGLRGYFRETLTLAEARDIVRRRLDEREQNFLRLVERGVYGHPTSPYRALLERAGCELGDLRQMVRTRGLEPTLTELHHQDVYVTFEEFKGRTPIVRGSWSMEVTAGDFDNPLTSRAYQAQSGGTTGAGTRVMIDLDHLRRLATHGILCHDAYSILGAPGATWFGSLPASSGIGGVLSRSLYGQTPERWFTPVDRRDLHYSRLYDLATFGILTMGRLCGVPLPRPERVPLDEAVTIARWMAERLSTHGRCVLTTQLSKALRVALAASENGLDLTGAVFWAGGEPPTSAKVRYITESGARYIPTYWVTEAGMVGSGCLHASEVDDTHFFHDTNAIIEYDVQTFGGLVNAFCFTTLSPSSPKFLLNTQVDDYGRIEQRSCGCYFEELGFTSHVSEIRSFSKLSGEGVTLVGSDMVRILDEVLPARFGGSPQDYQLAEEEDARGFTTVVLRVSPRLAIEDEGAISEAVLSELARSDAAADIAQAVWRQAGSLRVQRSEPVWTAEGKLLPLDLTRRARRQDRTAP